MDDRQSRIYVVNGNLCGTVDIHRELVSEQWPKFIILHEPLAIMAHGGRVEWATPDPCDYVYEMRVMVQTIREAGTKLSVGYQEARVQIRRQMGIDRVALASIVPQ